MTACHVFCCQDVVDMVDTFAGSTQELHEAHNTGREGEAEGGPGGLGEPAAAEIAAEGEQRIPTTPTGYSKLLC